MLAKEVGVKRYARLHNLQYWKVIHILLIDDFKCIINDMKQTLTFEPYTLNLKICKEPYDMN